MEDINVALPPVEVGFQLIEGELSAPQEENIRGEKKEYVTMKAQWDCAQLPLAWLFFFKYNIITSGLHNKLILPKANHLMNIYLHWIIKLNKKV